MTYQIKDQDITPPKVEQLERRSVASDGVAAVAMAFAALGLIVLVLSQVIH
jgi:hypothetical protein